MNPIFEKFHPMVFNPQVDYYNIYKDYHCSQFINAETAAYMKIEVTEKAIGGLVDFNLPKSTPVLLQDTKNKLVKYKAAAVIINTTKGKNRYLWSRVSVTADY